MQNHHNVYWIASLSNGDTITEGKGDYTVTTGELSPYQRLLAFCRDNDVHLTSISLATRDGKRWNLPSAGRDPKFHAFASLPQPVSYKMFRKVAMDANSIEGMQNAPKQDVHTCIEARYADGRCLQVWVNEENYTSWSLLTYEPSE